MVLALVLALVMPVQIWGWSAGGLGRPGPAAVVLGSALYGFVVLVGAGITRLRDRDRSGVLVFLAWALIAPPVALVSGLSLAAWTWGTPLICRISRVDEAVNATVLALGGGVIGDAVRLWPALVLGVYVSGALWWASTHHTHRGDRSGFFLIALVAGFGVLAATVIGLSMACGPFERYFDTIAEIHHYIVAGFIPAMAPTVGLWAVFVLLVLCDPTSAEKNRFGEPTITKTARRRAGRRLFGFWITVVAVLLALANAVVIWDLDEPWRTFRDDVWFAWASVAMGVHILHAVFRERDSIGRAWLWLPATIVVFWACALFLLA